MELKKYENKTNLKISCEKSLELSCGHDLSGCDIWKLDPHGRLDVLSHPISILIGTIATLLKLLINVFLVFWTQSLRKEKNKLLKRKWKYGSFYLNNIIWC